MKFRKLWNFFNEGNEIIAEKLNNHINDARIIRPEIVGEPYKIVTENLSLALEILTDFIRNNVYSILWFNVKKTDLEDVFINIVGEEKNEQDI